MTADDHRSDHLARRVPWTRCPRGLRTRPRSTARREILLVDPNFADWPLDERGVDRLARALGRLAARR